MNRTPQKKLTSIEDTIGYQNDTPACVVCGKNVEHGGGFARVNHKGTMVDLCCTGCVATFEQVPEPHLARLTKVLHHRAFQELIKPPEANQRTPFP